MEPAEMGAIHIGAAGPGIRPGRWAALAPLAGLLLVSVAMAALCAPEVAGAATASTEVITQPGQVTPLNSGGSVTPYSVLLPSGASCPGDTAHDGYHVFSYLVPQGVSPTAVSFKTGDPSKWFGYIANGTYFGAVNTAEDTGQVVSLPAEFVWTRLTPQDLFAHGDSSATWEGGIACADVHGVVTDYWNSQIVFTASASDPGGFTWKVVQSPASSSGAFSIVLAVVLVAVGVGFALLAVVLSRRRREEAHVGR
jgi:hypothetical protein